MSRIKKREPLVVGQRVFIEVLGGWVINREREITEYEIVETNKTSAYAVQVKYLSNYHEGYKRVPKTRIILRTNEVVNNILGYDERLWLTKEDFECNVQYNKEVKELRAKAIHLVNQMNVNELRKVLEIR